MKQNTMSKEHSKFQRLSVFRVWRFVACRASTVPRHIACTTTTLPFCPLVIDNPHLSRCVPCIIHIYDLGSSLRFLNVDSFEFAPPFGNESPTLPYEFLLFSLLCFVFVEWMIEFWVWVWFWFWILHPLSKNRPLSENRQLRLRWRPTMVVSIGKRWQR